MYCARDHLETGFPTVTIYSSAIPEWDPSRVQLLMLYQMLMLRTVLQTPDMSERTIICPRMRIYLVKKKNLLASDPGITVHPCHNAHSAA